MKALVCRAPGCTDVEDWPEPKIDAGQVLIKVAAAGLCGTDRHITDGSYQAGRPLVLGHEVAGVVQEAAGSVHVSIGDRVAIDPNLPCDRCDACHGGRPHLCRHLTAVGVTRDGGLAPWVAVPARLCHRVPQSLPTHHAILAEPLACVVHALDRAQPLSGTRAAVWGLGTAGLMMIQCLRASGISELTAISPHAEHRELAEKLGATRTLCPDDARAGLEVDLAVEASGSLPAFASAFDALAPGGHLLLYGVMNPEDRGEIFPERIFRKELRISGSYVGPGTMDRALALLAAGTVNAHALLGDTVSLEEAGQWARREGARKRAKVHVLFP